LIYNSFGGTFFAGPTKIANAIIFGPQYKTPFLQTIPMNKIKNIVFSALLTIGAFVAVTFNSCKSDDSPVDPCAAVVCQNGGACSNGSCSCPVGYEGTLCETPSVTKFIRTWRTATEACTVSGSNAQYDITITSSSTSAATLLISNVYGSGRTVTATLTNANAFTIASQPFGSSGTISGTGSIANGQLTISYSVSVGGINDVCNNVVFTAL
jgi:hypothetical protein